MLTETVNRLLAESKTDINEIQSTIHPELLFKRNSVNLLIGRRGSGKTYNVFREMIKLGKISHEYETGYSQLIYVTNKLSDNTFHKMKKHLKMQVIKVRFEDAEECLTKIIEAKEDYNEIIAKDLMSILDNDYANELLDTLGVNDLSRKVIHTAVLYDDAIEIFKNKKNKLYRLLFENRQPNITYFLCLQAPFDIAPSVKANVDALWLFGGFSSKDFNALFYQLSCPWEREDVWNRYKELTMNQAIIFEYGRDGAKLRLVLE